MKEHIMKERMMSRESLVHLVAILAGMSVLCLGGLATAATITDEFSTSPLNSMWEVSASDDVVQSSFSGGTMAFSKSVSNATAWTLIQDYESGTGSTVSFDLCQTAGSAGNYMFRALLFAGDKYYRVDMTPNPSYYSTTGFRLIGFDGANYTSALGANGTAVSASGWQKLSLAFDPGSGITFSQKLGEDTTVIASLANVLNLTRIDKVQLVSVSGAVGWHVDNFQVDYVPEPVTTSVLVVGGLGMLLRKR